MSDQHSPQGRRPHYHRGRRGGDRRGGDRRTTPPPPDGGGGREHVDVEQIMRDIRARIARRHGIDLTPQQIQELAARRLEAILEPKHVKPALLEQMRRAAGEPVATPPAAPAVSEPALEESDLYVSHRKFLRTLRRWLNPLLKLFINPAPLVTAINAQARRVQEAEARESELYARQAEWNALHYEILQRLVTEVSRTAIETQSLAMHVESLAAKVDFNERRVRSLENTGAAARPAARPVPPPEPARDVSPLSEQGGPPESAEGGADSARRRRRRRRGRRASLPGSLEAAAAHAGAPASAEPDTDEEAAGGMDGDNGEIERALEPERGGAAPEGAELPGSGVTALEPAHAFSLLQPVERHPAVEPSGSAPQQPSGASSPPPRASEPGDVAPEPSRDEPAAPPPPDRGTSGSDER